LNILRGRERVEEIHHEPVELIGMLKVRQTSGVLDCNQMSAIDGRGNTRKRNLESRAKMTESMAGTAARPTG